MEPHLLVGGGVLDAPAGGEGRAEEQAAAVFPVGADDDPAGTLERDLPLGIAVADLDPYTILGAQAQDVGGGARMHDGVGDQFAGEDDGVVDDIGVSPTLQGVADESAGGRHGPPDRVEAGSRPRGDHRTPRTRLARLCHDSACPSRCPVVVLAPRRPRRADRGGWTAGCQVTYLRCPSGCRSRLFPPTGGGDAMRSCRTVMAWFGHGETLGRLSETARAVRSTPAGGTRWSLAWRRVGTLRARKADGPGTMGQPRWTQRL